jgi:hypothetical protein
MPYMVPHQHIAADIQAFDIAQEEAAKEAAKEAALKKMNLRARLIAEERDRDRQRRHVGGGVFKRRGK